MPGIHLWCPSIRASEGGIESYSLSLARALIEIAGEQHITILVRNHAGADICQALGSGVRHGASGWLPRALWTFAFGVLVVWRALRERPDLIISTHLNAPASGARSRRPTFCCRSAHSRVTG